MTEKPDNNQIEQQSDPMMDTQQLLGMEPHAEGDFALEDILAEFGAAGKAKTELPAESPAAQEPPEIAGTPDTEPPPGPSPPAEPPSRKKWWSKKAVPQEETADAPPDVPDGEPQPVPEPDVEGAGQVEDETNPAMMPDAPEQPSAAPASETAAPDEPPAQNDPDGAETAPDVPADAPSPPNSRAGGEDPKIQPVPMEAIESIMANTVDAVKEEQELRQERLRKRLDKAKKAVSRSLKKKDSVTRHPLPDVENEPNPAEPAMWHKRRLRDSRKYLPLAVLVTLLLWLPWALTQFWEITVPFFSDSADNAALCVLVPQAAVSILCWPVFRAAIESLKEGTWSIYATAALCTLVTLLDEMTLLLLPKRVDAAPLGGVAAVLLVSALWGLSGIHKGMSESLRTAAMGEPSKLVDRCGDTIAKGGGRRKGFYTRISMEDTPAQWQRLLLPVLAAASLVFAVLSSVGQEQPQNLLWCWSVVLCASSPLVFPFAYSIPFGRLAAKLARSGAAVAGQYGAAVLSSSKKLAVTDEDLFPQNMAASLGNVTLYGEERPHALSYAATLLVQGGGILGRIFRDACQSERISLQSIEHFHIHDDGGLSGMIHGETVLVGTSAFMRHKAVRLPKSVPAKTSVCLAVDGQFIAVFNIKYNASDTVEYALRAMRKNGMQITLASRDGNVNPKLLKERFGVSGNIVYPDMGERLTLSDPERDAEGPNALMYRDGLLSFAALAIGSKKLCQTVLIGDILAILSGIAGSLLGFYLTFTGSYEVLTPALLLTYAVLWVVPLLPVVWSVDQL